MTPRAALVAALSAGLVAGACRFGGPTADPLQYVAGDADTAAEGGDGAEDATVLPTADAETQDAIDDLAIVPADADDGSADAVGDDAADGEGGVCVPGPAPAVCDPIHNTGCVNTSQQCDIDTTQTSMRAGVCVFGASADGAACSSSIFTESCPPRFACVASACRHPCSCDTDCDPGQCCSDTTGPTGWKLCGLCH
jgi:hypothetical protein